MEKFIELDTENISSEHICCAISDKKCANSYLAKKDWLKKEFDNGYVFRRLDERAKIFIEYGPTENAWIPITAPNYLNVNCLGILIVKKWKTLIKYSKALNPGKLELC